MIGEVSYVSIFRNMYLICMTVYKLMKMFSTPKAREGLREKMGLLGASQNLCLSQTLPEHLRMSQSPSRGRGSPYGRRKPAARLRLQGTARGRKRLGCVAVLPDFLKSTCAPELSSTSLPPVSGEATGLLHVRAAFLKLHMQTHHL